ncbi:uncharacterized protein LY89DRAFT_437354 [Mollisia scopiformis]|uniref:Uncharacterized protein n=1 Tax=Mollisia scopiformis TaxID=149040 RepID=A0A194XKC0_MOLSC|nr:uncharacterized protein LY89DRAFT_437354 [Mollisia scopiformis]KUJ20237.1 hypothetical protein LY89DRAFT_437354 [Mollisia scopiformis]
MRMYLPGGYFSRYSGLLLSNRRALLLRPPQFRSTPPSTIHHPSHRPNYHDHHHQNESAKSVLPSPLLPHDFDPSRRPPRVLTQHSDIRTPRPLTNPRTSRTLSSTWSDTPQGPLSIPPEFDRVCIAPHYSRIFLPFESEVTRFDDSNSLALTLHHHSDRPSSFSAHGPGDPNLSLGQAAIVSFSV